MWIHAIFVFECVYDMLNVYVYYLRDVNLSKSIGNSFKSTVYIQNHYHIFSRTFVIRARLVSHSVI